MMCNTSVALAGNNSASNKITATAQQTQGIKGTVTDGAGEPLIGATINAGKRFPFLHIRVASKAVSTYGTGSL